VLEAPDLSAGAGASATRARPVARVWKTRTAGAAPGLASLSFWYERAGERPAEARI
jgi:hypothetical protein